MSTSRGFRVDWITRPSRKARCVVLVGLVLVDLSLYAIANLAPELSVQISPDQIAAEQGHAYIVQLAQYSMFPLVLASDNNEQPNRSRLELFRAGIPLGPDHAVHDEIRQLGNGRYSHWDTYLLFSTPANEDPRSSVSLYSIRAPRSLHPTAAIIAGVMTVAGALWCIGPLGIRVVLINVAILLAVLPVAEVVIRLALFGTVFVPRPEPGLGGQMQAHPTRGWSLRPNNLNVIQTLDYVVTSRTNVRGFRDLDRDFHKPAARKRIVLLGDSFVEGYYVRRTQSLAYLLEAELSDHGYEVINLGVRGYGTIQSHITLREEGLLYQPDLVLLFFAMNNDLHNDSRELQVEARYGAAVAGPSSPHIEFDQAGDIRYSYPDHERNKKLIAKNQMQALESIERRPWWKDSVLYFALEELLLSRLGGETNIRNTRPTAVLRDHDPNITYGEILKAFDPELGRSRHTKERYEELFEQAWRVTCTSLGIAKDLAEGAGSEFLVVTVPSAAQVSAEFLQSAREIYPTLEFDTAASSRELRRCASRYGFELLDLFPAFVQETQRRDTSLYYPLDRHWNPDGVRFAASQVLAHIEKRSHARSER